jgi:hypothetical protein
MDQKPYPVEKARGGEIILIGAVVLAVILMIVR